jgi:hypothetical protein
MEINRAEPTALSSPLMRRPKLRWAMITGVAVIVAAAIVYGVAIKPRQTSTSTQPQFPVQAVAPMASQPVAPSPQQPPAQTAASAPSQPTAQPQQSQLPFQAITTPSSQPLASPPSQQTQKPPTVESPPAQAAVKPQVPESVKDKCRDSTANKMFAACSTWIRLDPNSAEAYERRGFADDLKNLTDRAIADNTKAIALDPHHASVYYFRGEDYEKKGLYDKAIADYRAAMKLDPNYEKPQDGLKRLSVTP